MAQGWRTRTALSSDRRSRIRPARLDLWSKRADGRWVNVGTTTARLGAKGMVPGQYRKQDTYTTPSGRYTIGPAFGPDSRERHCVGISLMR